MKNRYTKTQEESLKLNKDFVEYQTDESLDEYMKEFDLEENEKQILNNEPRVFDSKTTVNNFGFKFILSYIDVVFKHKYNFKEQMLRNYINGLFVSNTITNLTLTQKEKEDILRDLYILVQQVQQEQNDNKIQLTLNPEIPTDEKLFKEFIKNKIENEYFEETINGFYFKLKYSNFIEDLANTVINHLNTAKLTWN